MVKSTSFSYPPNESISLNQAFLRSLDAVQIPWSRRPTGREGIYDLLTEALAISEEVNRCIREAGLRQRQAQEEREEEEKGKDNAQ